MRPLILTADEVRAALAGTRSEIHRPVDMRGIRETAWITRCSVDPETHEAEFSGEVDYFVRRVACPFGAPGDVLFGQEAWRSWRETCDDFDQWHACGPHCDQVYVAYEATPKRGYRPLPDAAAITYLHESSSLSQDPRLLGPWEPAETMPVEMSRLALVTRTARAELLDDVWTWIGVPEVLRRENGEPMPPSEVQR